MVGDKAVCPACGSQFTVKWPNQRYCRRACHLVNPEKRKQATCRVCGQPFVTRWVGHTVCSKACSVKAAHQGTRDKVWTEEERADHSEKRKAWIEAHPEWATEHNAKVWAGYTPEQRATRVAPWNRAGTKAAGESKQSSVERMVQAVLTEMGVPFQAQVMVGCYCVDLLLEERKLIIEVDGCYWHGCQECGYSNPKRQAMDSRRDAWIQRRGYHVMRLWEHAIRADARKTVEALLHGEDSVRCVYDPQG